MKDLLSWKGNFLKEELIRSQFLRDKTWEPDLLSIPWILVTGAENRREKPFLLSEKELMYIFPHTGENGEKKIQERKRSNEMWILIKNSIVHMLPYLQRRVK